MQYITNFFGQVYGACNYGTSSYQNSSCQTTTGSAAGSTAGGRSVLTNTGFDILLIATLACFIVLVAVLVRFWKRPAKPAPHTDQS